MLYVQAAGQTPHELKLPDVPTSLVKPADRADYIISHFWDAWDTDDYTAVTDTAFMEQAFANFLSVFPYSSGEDAIKKAVESFTGKASVNKESVEMAAYLVDKYLQEPESPMHSKEYFLLFAPALLDMPFRDEADNVRLKYNIHLASLNRIGTKANDFIYMLPEGGTNSLYGTEHQGRLMLVFYDPECDRCTALEQELANSPDINGDINSGNLTVLAICVEGDEEMWHRRMQELPDNWLHGFDDAGENAGEVYDLRTIPSVYMLSPENVVESIGY